MIDCTANVRAELLTMMQDVATGVVHLEIEAAPVRSAPGARLTPVRFEMIMEPAATMAA